MGGLQELSSKASNHKHIILVSALSARNELVASPDDDHQGKDKHLSDELFEVVPSLKVAVILALGITCVLDA